MQKVKVTINGEEIFTPADKTILEVVHNYGIDQIPTLCHDDRLEPYGSCFLCVVEIKGVNKLVPACSTRVSEGMVIFTDNERIRSARRTALQLLLSNHYADCIGPCKNNCPAGVDAQGYIALISMGRYEEALQLVKENNPLPLSIGRVCVRDCEKACRREIVDETIGINFLKRYIADIDARHKWKPTLQARKQQRVAVVGGGPAGLTCAYYLTVEGYGVTIFEKLPQLGGMLRYGIPEYRLPKKVLDDEINWIVDLGVEVRTNVEMGSDFDIQSLFRDGFDTIFLAVGAHKASSMRLEGEEAIKGVYNGIDFLRNIHITGKPELKGTVVVVGGGNTAIDAARTALRCGADQVKMVYRRSIKEMPAHPEEIHAAQEEGIEILFLTNPRSLISEQGQLKGIECLKMRLVEAKAGRPRPVPIEGSEFVVDCEYLIGAIGQQVDNAFVYPQGDIELDKWGTIRVLETTLETSIHGVFAGGDVVTGPWTAIGAIAQGKHAAESIDNYLRTGKARKRKFRYLSFKHTFNPIPRQELAHVEKLPKEKMPELTPQERKNNFKEVELGFSDKQAQNEPRRCLECGCVEYYDCRLRRCADDFEVDISDYLGEVNKYQVDDRHPFVIMDANKCINCGRCVRTCGEVLDISALGFVHRGFKSVVRPALEKPLPETTCVSCGNCIDTCPTGALSENFPSKILGTLPRTDHPSVCYYCSLGCRINYKVISEDIFYVANSSAEVKKARNKGYTCSKGRFGYRFLTGSSRLKQPLIRDNGESKEANWRETLDLIHLRFKNILDQHGPGAVAVFASPKMSNEELYLLQKFARKDLKTNQIASLSSLLYGCEQDSLDEAVGATVSTANLDELDRADIIVVMNADLEEESLILELKLKEARQKGARLVVVNSTRSRLARLADLWIDAKKGTGTVLINGLIKETIDAGAIQPNAQGFVELKQLVADYDTSRVCEQTGIYPKTYDTLVSWLRDRDANVIFVTAIDSRKEKSKNNVRAIGNFLLLTDRVNREKNGLILLRDFINSAGLVEMGASSHYLPGCVKPFEYDEIRRIGNLWGFDLTGIFKPVDLKEKLLDKEIKAALIFREDPLAVPENIRYLEGIDFLAVVGFSFTETARRADVVLPASAYIEGEGTYTTCDGRWQQVKPIAPPRTGLENWQLIARLARLFGTGFDFQNIDDVLKEIRTVNRFYRESRFRDFRGRDLFRDRFYTEDKLAHFAIYETDTTPIEAHKPLILRSENYFHQYIRPKLHKN